MIIKLYYGEDSEKAVELNTAFSLLFLSRMFDKKLLGKDFMKSIAAGEMKIDDFDDIFNIPYCCYLNATNDPMTKEEFNSKFIMDMPLLRNIYQLVMHGNTGDSGMKNMFRLAPDPKLKVKRLRTSGEQ